MTSYYEERRDTNRTPLADPGPALVNRVKVNAGKDHVHSLSLFTSAATTDSGCPSSPRTSGQTSGTTSASSLMNYGDTSSSSASASAKNHHHHHQQQQQQTTTSGVGVTGVGVASDDDDSGCAIEEYSWVPQGLSQIQVHQYMNYLPDEKVPYVNSVGEKFRLKQLIHQLPPHDYEATYCQDLCEEERKELNLFSSRRKKESLGRATVKGLPVSHQGQQCYKCRQRFSVEDLVVFAPRAGTSVCWHPSCFCCAVCDELLVDLIYFYREVVGVEARLGAHRLMCGRHHAESLKPRCSACDEIIFSGECTEAEGTSWHMKHFTCHSCQKNLGGLRYVMRQSKPFCCECFDITHADICDGCKLPISIDQPTTEHQNHHWHASCFRCLVCRSSLVDRPFIAATSIDGTGSAIYCSKACAEVSSSTSPPPSQQAPPSHRLPAPQTPLDAVAMAELDDKLCALASDLHVSSRKYRHQHRRHLDPSLPLEPRVITATTSSSTNHNTPHRPLQTKPRSLSGYQSDVCVGTRSHHQGGGGGRRNHSSGYASDGGGIRPSDYMLKNRRSQSFRLDYRQPPRLDEYRRDPMTSAGQPYADGYLTYSSGNVVANGELISSSSSLNQIPPHHPHQPPHPMVNRSVRFSPSTRDNEVLQAREDAAQGRRLRKQARSSQHQHQLIMSQGREINVDIPEHLLAGADRRFIEEDNNTSSTNWKSRSTGYQSDPGGNNARLTSTNENDRYQQRGRPAYGAAQSCDEATTSSSDSEFDYYLERQKRNARRAVTLSPKSTRKAAAATSGKDKKAKKKKAKTAKRSRNCIIS